MVRHYKTPILLIEFEGDRAFNGVVPGGDIGPQIESHSVLSRLVLLTLHFPRLRCEQRREGGRCDVGHAGLVPGLGALACRLL